MKKFPVILILLCAAVTSCAPVLRHDLMEAGIREFSLPDVVKSPDAYEGKLFVFGGIIVTTKATPEGSLIEALLVPVNARGYLKDVDAPQNRFLALFPKESGFLDPIIFKKNREITIAAEFKGLREGEIDEMLYTYPFFVIRQLYLWAERPEYYWPYYEPYPYWWDYPYRWYGYPPGFWRYRVPPPYWW